jgi:hypothetical protein
VKGLSAKRIQVRLGDVWKSPNLHVLLTQEEEVVVARCLDFTISSHGENEKEAIQSLDEAIKQYLLTAIEENAMDAVYGPAQNKYWRMFNEIEAKSAMGSCYPHKPVHPNQLAPFETGETYCRDRYERSMSNISRHTMNNCVIFASAIHDVTGKNNDGRTAEQDYRRGV